MTAGTLASDPHARRRLVVAVIGTVALLALVAAGSGAFRSNGSGIAVRDSAVVLDATAAIAAAIATAAVIFGVALLRLGALRHPNERSVSRRASRSAGSNLICTERSMVVGSRPMAAQCSSRTAFLRSNDDAPALDSSAYVTYS